MKEKSYENIKWVREKHKENVFVIEILPAVVYPVICMYMLFSFYIKMLKMRITDKVFFQLLLAIFFIALREF